MLEFHKCQTSCLLSLQAREKYCTTLKNIVTLGRNESVCVCVCVQSYNWGNIHLTGYKNRVACWNILDLQMD